MQKLYQRSMFHLLRVKGQLAPALLAKVTVVEVISAKPKVISVFPALRYCCHGYHPELKQLEGFPIPKPGLKIGPSWLGQNTS